ncbi:MAG: flavin reductase family protein [Chloroflexi bacterium]|nr:flavin reductase family protein [Chloroflexota bacterium]
MPVDPETLRSMMRSWATGVTIVASAHNGQQHGMTVSSFTSVSLEPPLVLVSLEKITRTHGLVEQAGRYSVCVLHQGQQAISDRFGGRDTEHSDRFEGLAVRPGLTGMPILGDALAYLECTVVAAHDAGTHTLFIGEVQAAAGPDGGEPLLYFDRNYRRLANNRAAGSRP